MSDTGRHARAGRGGEVTHHPRMSFIHPPSGPPKPAPRPNRLFFDVNGASHFVRSHGKLTY